MSRKNIQQFYADAQMGHQIHNPMRFVLPPAKPSGVWAGGRAREDDQPMNWITWPLWVAVIIAILMS